MSLNETSSSFDAADVLIRSTKVLLEQSERNNHPPRHISVPSGRSNINLYVQRLSDSGHVSCLTEKSKQGFMEEKIPPVIPANIPPSLSGGSEAQDHTASKQALGVAKKRHVPRAGKDTIKPIVIQTMDSEQKGRDLLISRYSADGRGAIAAALKQRSHSAPVRREVKVQLLDADPSTVRLQGTNGQQPSPAFPAGDGGAATAVAAITAATIAATAPIIQAQSEMEVRVAQVASELRRLQVAEGRARGLPGGGPEHAVDRTVRLEEQLTMLTQQRLQHLEKIQDQQLELQNRLLGTALGAVARTSPALQATVSAEHGVSELEQRPSRRLLTDERRTDERRTEERRTDKRRTDERRTTAVAHVGFTAVQDQSWRTQTGWVKSPLETPAPRDVIPKPTHWIPTGQNLRHRNPTYEATEESSGGGRPLEWIPVSPRSPTRSPADSAGARGVAVATVNDTESRQFREDPPKASISSAGGDHPVSTSIKPACSREPLGRPRDVDPFTHGAGESFGSVQQASAILQDLSRLKEEMRNLLQPPELVDVVPPRVAPLSQASMLQKPPPPASMFEDAGCVLRQVKQGRKVLEENLQAVLRAKDGEVLHTQLEALASNRDASEELRVKKTVDAWISTLSKEIEDELAQLGTAVDRGPAAGEFPAPRVQDSRGGARAARGGALAGKGRAGTDRVGPEGKGSAAAVRRRPSPRDCAISRLPLGQRHTSTLRSGEEQRTQTPLPLKSDDDEAYLAKVYGRALYEGQRRTLKKGPYLRFSSPTPKARVQRPKLIESVKGVKMKSSKTQTSVSGVRAAASLLQPTPSEPQYLFSPCSPAQQEPMSPGSPLRGFLIPMAIPLGEPRVDGEAPLPSRVIISNKPAVVTTSLIPAPSPAPTGAPPIHKPNSVLLEVCSEPKRPAPQLQIQVQPSVNIESVMAPRPSPSLPLLSSPIQDGAGSRASQDDAEQDDAFPGTGFLAVTDISQESEAEAPGSPIELNGLPSPAAALYHGPAFPLQPAPPTPLPEQGLGAIAHTHTLENRLVDWVEQQLMARVISGMFPPPDPANQSEPAESVTSDIVEAAGGGGLQLFVQAGVPVDSQLIRQCVNEVLTELIAATLGQTQGPREPAPPATAAQDTHPQETAVPTPVPTPEPPGKESPPALKGALSPVSTPALSEQPTPAQSPRDRQPQDPSLPDPEKTPVNTPTNTPVPSPSRLPTPRPPSEQPSLCNHPWGEVDLPLKEEDPHSEEEELGPAPVVLSVAHEEEVGAVTLPSVPVPPQPQRPPSAVVEEPQPSAPESVSVEESSSWSSPALTETETAARHISEGELLLSSDQIAVVRALEEEGFALPHPMTSFNSSLHGVQDMDYDPPSEGQVIRRPLIAAHHDPVLSLLARMELGPPNQSQQPEGCWDEESSGEVSEGQRPLLTTTQERVVTGHSLLPQEPAGQASMEQSPHTALNSPGQLNPQFTGWGGTLAEDGELSVNVQPTEEHRQTPDALRLFTPPPPPQPGDSTHQQHAAESLRPPRRPAVILVKRCQTQQDSGVEVTLQASGGDHLMSVTLPTVQPDDQTPSNQSPSVSSMEGDSHSGSCVF